MKTRLTGIAALNFVIDSAPANTESSIFEQTVLMSAWKTTKLLNAVDGEGTSACAASIDVG